MLAEGIPEELGQEWRVLHPFEIPGVRFPTDNTPTNQRRLAENDALVELIKTTEYLEDTPTWGQRDYWLYPLDMVTLSIEGEEEAEGEVEEEGNGKVKDHLKENKMEVWKRFLPWKQKRKWKRITSGNFQKGSKGETGGRMVYTSKCWKKRRRPSSRARITAKDPLLLPLRG